MTNKIKANISNLKKNIIVLNENLNKKLKINIHDIYDTNDLEYDFTFTSRLPIWMMKDVILRFDGGTCLTGTIYFLQNFSNIENIERIEDINILNNEKKILRQELI